MAEAELEGVHRGLGEALVMITALAAVMLALSALTSPGGPEILMTAVAVGLLVAHPALDAAIEMGPTDPIQPARMGLASAAALASVVVTRGHARGHGQWARAVEAVTSAVAIGALVVVVVQLVAPADRLVVATMLGSALACLTGGSYAQVVGVRFRDHGLVAMGILTATIGSARAVWVLAGGVPMTAGMFLLAAVGGVLAVAAALGAFFEALDRHDRRRDRERNRSVDLAGLTESTRRQAEVIHDQRSGLLAIEAAARSLSLEPSDQLLDALATEAARLRRRIDEASTTTGHFDVVSALRPVIDCVRPLQGEIRFDHPPEARAWGNPDESVEVVLSLLDNAHHHGCGPVDVVITSRTDEVEISVTDAGDGVHPALAEVVFERGVTTNATSRSGLGLFVARRLARLRGGDLVLSAHNAATFVLTLPTAEPSAASARTDAWEPLVYQEPKASHG